MRAPYVVGIAPNPQPSLGGSVFRHRPMMPVEFGGAAAALTRTGILDTGADDTVLPDWIASAIGVDLDGAEERKLALPGGAVVRCRYASVSLGITDGVRETYRWTAVVCFVPSLPRPVLGHAGFLQFFDVEFRGADREVILTPNRSFPGSGVPAVP